LAAVFGVLFVAAAFLLGLCFYNLRKAEAEKKRLSRQVNELEKEIQKLAVEPDIESAPPTEVVSGDHDGNIYSVD
jgi:uncharacterized membrane protein YciS (DUF1049 family)